VQQKTETPEKIKGETKLKAAGFALILSVLVSAMPAAAGSAQKDNR